MYVNCINQAVGLFFTATVDRSVIFVFFRSSADFVRQVSTKMGVSNRQVRNVSVWGEHGETALVDARYAQVNQLGHWNPLTTALHDDRWLRHDLVKVNLL